MLGRASQAVQNMRASQDAARALAKQGASPVPNGLAPGGLVVAPGAVPGATDGGAGLWQGADLPTEVRNGESASVTVKQNQQKAILTWQEFNVGRETELYFDQTAGGANAASWIALNRVLDPSAAPSKILGSIKAEGQVYVINRNGVIFGGASQVNVGSLVASSLSLSNEQFLAGINTSIVVGRDLAGYIHLPQFGDYNANLPDSQKPVTDSSQPAAFMPTTAPGSVVVEAGAEIVAASGGKVMLFAPKVLNSGLVSAQDGQVIMAAGEQVYLRTNISDLPEPLLVVRGLDVAVTAPMPWLFNYDHLMGALNGAPLYSEQPYGDSVRDTILPWMEHRAETVGYQVVNDGIVEANHGNITVVARNIVQNGLLSASTALNNRDGSIRLLAYSNGMMSSSGSYDPAIRYWETGTLHLMPGSVTSAMPDLSDTSEIELSALATRYKPGRVELRGDLIDIQSQANIIVPAGTISVVASKNTLAAEEPGVIVEQVRDGSRVYIGEDAYLSVAGLKDVLVAMERNVVEVDLGINELRDSPLYRDSWLRGLTVYVDRRESGAYTDGLMAGVQWVTDEDGTVIPGAWVGTPLADVSAWIGVGTTDLAELSTKAGSIVIKSGGSLVTRTGSLIDISGGSVRYKDGWISTTKLLGADGRLYDISEATPDKIFVGTAGQFARVHSRWGVTQTWTNPLETNVGRGRFEKGYTEGRAAGSVEFFAAEGVVLEGSYWGGTVVGERQAAAGQSAKAGSLTFGGPDNSDRAWLLDKLIIASDPVLLSEDFTATTPLDASWYSPPPTSALASRITFLDADVLSASGLDNIELHVSDDFTLAQGTILDLAPGSTFSVLVNTGDANIENFQIDGVIRSPGGTVNLLRADSVRFGADAAIDVSGQWFNELTNGVAALAPQVNGGTIALMGAQFEAGAVLDVSGGGWYKLRSGKPQIEVGDAGTIVLRKFEAAEVADADLRGYAAGAGGRLTVETSSSLQIGGDAPVDADTIRLSESLFADRGFRSVDVTTSGSIAVPQGVTIAQVPLAVDLRGVIVSRFASGTTITAMGPLAVLPLSERAKLEPTSLSLTGSSVTVGEGAVIKTDVRGTIAIETQAGSASGIEIAGRLEALAGTITLESPGRPITITGTGALIAHGVPVIDVRGAGIRFGSVLDGGSVGLTAASVIMEEGSLVDVAGAMGEIDLPQNGQSVQGGYAPVALASHGGRIFVSGAGSIEGTWRGQAGGTGARGGAVTLNSAVLVSETATTGSGLILRPSNLEAGGFADLVLASTVRLDNVDLVLGGSISIAGGLVNANGTDSRLAAPYIQLAGTASGGTPGGTLTLAASLVDVTQAGIRGFAETVLQVSDLRLLAGSQGQAALLDAEGSLTIEAGQVYPAGIGTIRASERIVVEQRGVAGTALSVGGILTLEAPVIEQNGTLKAPFGQIVLKASDRLTLAAGSVTSVSGDGLVLPYGGLSNNESWTIVDSDGGVPQIIASLPEKRITLDAPNVDLAAGSVVDISGGGDLHAWEHVPGPGGSHDVLSMAGVYAIVPALNNTVGGDRLWLDGGNGLAAGWYTLLPAHYALLPGAYAVQMVAGSQGTAAPKAVTLADGTTIMAGYQGNAYDGSQDQLSSAWRVMSGDVVRKYTEYNEAFASTFFASEAFKQTQYRLTGVNIVTPRLPMDGGALVLKATQDLILNGQLQSQAAAGGRGGLVDIAAQKIAILGAEQDASALRADGYLVLDAANVSGFGAGSLLIGGVRNGDVLGLKVDVTASDIVVRNGSGSALTGAEIILAASETIDVGAGSVILAQGEAPTGAGDLVIAPQVAEVISDNGTPSNSADDYVQTPARDWGALIRVSTGDVVRVRRTNVDTTVGGQVTIGAGAILDGGKALLIDATRNAFVTQATLSGAALSLASGSVGFGGGSGLVLDAAALAALSNSQHLTLRSYTSIDFHRGVDLSGLTAVTFDAAALVGYGTDAISVVANRLVLENTASTFAEPVGAGHGSLSLTAAELAFGEGAKALRGFDTITFTGATRVVGESNGSLDAGAAIVTFSTPVLTGRGGAAQSVTTTGALSVIASGVAGARDLDSLGARWSLTGGSIDFGGRIDALGGAAKLTASAGDVVLANGSLIDVGGFGKQFFDVAEYTDAGSITLAALGGSVLVGSGATLDLSAHPGGGGAGTLAVTSDGGNVVLGGTIKAQAAAGQRGGSFSLDIAALADFTGLNQRLSAAGFSRSREFRIRTGNVRVDGETVTESFLLAADQGHVTVDGIIDARATYGGSIAIYGGNGLTMTSAAVLRAGATDTIDNLGSGRVTLGISGGSMNIQGGLIDVAGGEGGKVTLRAPVIEQAGADTVNVAFAGSIAGAREIVLEGFKRFDLADLAGNPDFVGVTINGNGQAELDLAAKAAGRLNMLADYGTGTLVEFVQDFDVSAAYGALGGLSAQANFHARPGMQLDYAGDIVLKSNWNLGAGIVDEASALAAGIMAIDPILNKPYVVSDRKGDLLRDHTTMVYRTGGSILGEPGTLALRAGGDLILEGGITDGFFQFGDKLDPTYVATADSFIGNTTLVVQGGFNNGEPADWWPLTSWSNLDSWGLWNNSFLALGFGVEESVLQSDGIFIPASSLNVPYSAAANSPAATGTLPGGAGDALRYAELFPPVTISGGATLAPASWSYTLVAGAAPTTQSADPLQRASATMGSIILHGRPSFTYTPEPAQGRTQTAEVELDPWFYLFSQPGGWEGTIPLVDWLDHVRGQGYSGISNDSLAIIRTGTAGNDPARGVFEALLSEFSAQHGLVLSSTDPSVGYDIIDDWSGHSIAMPLATYQLFYSEKLLPNLSRIIGAYSSAGPSVPSVQTAVVPHSAVRSGTGDISIAANRDIRLEGTSSIYTAGRRDLAALDDFAAPRDAIYGVGGGHLHVAAGTNIEAALPDNRTQMQHYTEWLKRQGATDSSYVYLPGQQSSWWVDYANFQRGIGALAGGNVVVSAGDDLVNLTVALPTNGRVRGGRIAGERKLLELRNGGAMTVEAGGAVNAGYYYIGRGAGSIEAGEFAVGREVNITISGRATTYPIAPILSLGDATLNVRTAGELRLQTVVDPLLVGTGDDNSGVYMSGQTDRAALSLVSTGSNVVLVGQAQFLSKDLSWSGNYPAATRVNSYAGNLYPSKVRITALNGSIINEGTIYTLPGSSPELRILAANNLFPGGILMARATSAMIPSPLDPVGGDGAPIQLPSFYTLQNVLYNDIAPLSLTGHAAHVRGLGNPDHLPNEDDYEPSRIYALNGSILGTVRQTFTGLPPVITTNEQTWFRAGTDIRNIDFELRNIHPTDVSILEAGNDIIGGTIQNPLQPVRSGSIRIQGPGALVLSAVRDVYGTTLELYSTGNRTYDTNNRAIAFTQVFGLPDQGAAITVMAGLNGKQPAYDAFGAAYLDPANIAAMPDYLKTTLADGTVVPTYLIDLTDTRNSGSVKVVRRGLVSFMQEMTGETLSPLEAWARYQALPQLAQERFLRQVYMQELREAGVDQNEPGVGGLPRNGGYNRGYAAIEALFPGEEWKGDVTIGNALFRTMAGGDIEVLAPGGGLQVAALGSVAPPGYGLVTLGYGHIDIFARNNVVVNRSRILTFGGGDEIIWSTLGDIDAGRGAKTTRVSSAPEIATDKDGKTEVLEKADISGSGIGTIIGFTGVEEGDVHLIAPLGTVNAGDAGIRVAGNLNLAALHVVNAANIKVGGESKGIPQIKVPDIGGLTDASSAAGAAAQEATAAPQNTPQEQPSIIIVEVIGYGGGDPAPAPKQDQGRKKPEEQGYNPNAPVRILGHGALTGPQLQALTPEEQARKKEIESKL